MILTGKAKELFFEWLENLEIAPYKVMFDDLPIIIQQAYIIEWLDSIGVYIQISCDLVNDTNLETGKLFERNEFDCYVDSQWTGTNFKSRQEATTEAIKKANEIINS